MNFRDVELLSSYLDGQTSPSDFVRLEARLKTDLELGRALAALRESRGLLRQLPHRRAPRNFTLTRQMVGLKPPLPRAYPVFRFATALAAFLFVFSIATNQVGQLAASAPVPAMSGSSGGGGDAGLPFAESAAATEAPTAAPTIEAAQLAPEATQESAADAGRTANEDSATPKTTPPGRTRFMFSSLWLMGLALTIVIGAAGMFLFKRLAARKWRAK